MFHSAHLPAAIAATSLSLMLSSIPARAALLFTGNSHGSFGSPTVDRTADPDATFSIERSAPGSETFVLGKPGEGSMPNKLTFSPTAFSTLTDQPFSLGTLTYLNGQTYRGTNVSSVPFNLQLDLEAPIRSQTRFDYRFTFDLTPNTNQESSADRLSLSSLSQPQTFDLEAATYTIEPLGFSQDSAQTFLSTFEVAEDQEASSQLFARIKLAKINPVVEPPASRDIPEPATLSALALAGVWLASRQAKASVRTGLYRHKP